MPTRGELEIPEIAPVAAEIARPKWSVMIPTYNAAETIAETLRSVLAHGPAAENAQIAVVDNVSTDDTLAIVTEVCQTVGASDRVEVYQNESNLGMAGNWTACVCKARGELVHILHADDYVRPGFYDAVEAALAATPQADVCVVRTLVVDGCGEAERLSGRLGRTGDRLTIASIAYGNEFYCPAVVVRRSCYERIGGFTPSLRYVPDWEMWSRILASGSGVYVNETLVCYREAAGNLTNRYSRSADDLRELVAFGDILRERVPGFVPLRWRGVLKQHAVWAMANWERAGDAAAYEANRKFWRQFASTGEKLDIALAALKNFTRECERPLRNLARRIKPKRK